MTRVADKGQPAIKNIGAYMKRVLEEKYASEAVEEAPLAPRQDLTSIRDIQTKFTQHRKC